MFYIVENLVDYLGSEEITNLKNQNKGGIFYIRPIYRPAMHVVTLVFLFGRSFHW
jgi:hypothetical protein